MVNLFNEIISFDGVNFQDHIEIIGLTYIFEPIFKAYDDNFLHVKIAKFIVYGYSAESNKISVGGDRRKELSNIFKSLDIKEELYDWVVLLKNKDVLKSVQLWMAKQDGRQIEYLFTLQTSYIQQQTASLADLKKSDLINTDYDQKHKCIGYMVELKKMIKDAESELQQNDPKLREAYEEVKMAAKKVETHGPEKHAW